MATLRHLSRYRKLLTYSNDPTYLAMQAEGTSKTQTQRLHAKIYLAMNYINSIDLATDGTMSQAADPYKQTAKYFGVWQQPQNTDALPVATGRLIVADPNQTHTAFQTYRDMQLFPQARQYIEAIPVGKCAEVSGLAKQPGISSIAMFILYRCMWQYSIDAGYSLWIMSVDERLYGRLQSLFGSALIPAGEPVFYKGHTVIPALLDLEPSLRVLKQNRLNANVINTIMKRRMSRFMLHGMQPQPNKE